MPHVSSVSGAGDDLGSKDEVKVFKDEGEDEKRSSENLTEDKTSLIDLTESQEKSVSPNYTSSKNASRSDLSPVFGKLEPTPHTSSFNMGYLVSPYPYPNGATAPLPVSMASKIGLGATHLGAGLPFFCHNGDHLGQPPPAHMGIPFQPDKAAGEYWRTAPPIQEFKRLLAATALSRPSMYPFSSGQYPYPILSPEMSQVAASWHSPSMYPSISSGSGFRGPYPSSLPITSTSLPSDFYRFSPTSLMAAHPGLSPHSHAAIVTPGPKQELHSDHNHRSHHSDHKNSSSAHSDNSKSQESSHSNNNSNDKNKKPHIKKPLNAFMLYMKEMRAKVVAECTLKESAAINQILGRRWHALGRDEQAKYYELARRERQLHMQLYPDWSSRANQTRGKKRKRSSKQELTDTGNSMKKCRARYGLDQQNQWCKPCRRKKRCIRYVGKDDGNQSEDNLGSVGSIGTPPDDDDQMGGSISSPGGLSGLSSLTSPSMILPSPSSLASPCMSLQSPLTPHTLDIYDVKPPLPLILPTRNPVGTNPHDINNPLSVNQLVKSPAPPHSSANKTHHPISVT